MKRLLFYSILLIVFTFINSCTSKKTNNDRVNEDQTKTIQTEKDPSRSLSVIEIELSVSSNVITVNPQQCSAKRGDQLKFYTNIANMNFQIIFDNYDNFLDIQSPVVTGEVSQNNPFIIKINTPEENINVKTYLVRVISSPDSIPLPPAAPPRVILSQ